MNEKDFFFQKNQVLLMAPSTTLLLQNPKLASSRVEVRLELMVWVVNLGVLGEGMLGLDAV